jgi:hypothetical protein
MPETPRHYVRCDNPTWNKANAKAREEGTTLSNLVRYWLVEYIGDDKPEDEIDRITQRLTGLRQRIKLDDTEWERQDNG